MTRRKGRERGGFNLVIMFYMLLVLVVLLTSATYTWFTLSRTPEVHDLTLYVGTARGLMISADPTRPWEDWGEHINFNELISEETVLKPATWSDAEQRFYATEFGADGRIRKISYALTDEVNANGDSNDSYYVTFTFYAKTDENVKVSLADPNELTGNFVVGKPEWDAEKIVHGNGGRGAQSAVRIGFRITKFDNEGNPLEEEPIFIIYEPNCDSHMDYTYDYKPTESIDGSENLVPAERLIRQTSTAWMEADPVQHGVVKYYFGKFLDDTFLFDLDEGQMAQIDTYLWLEGQDADCTYEIGEEAKIIAAIHFNSTARGNSGFEDID